MPAQLLFDLSRFDLNRVSHNRDAIYTALPQRHEFMLLDGFVHLDPESGEGIAYSDVRDDAWWCKAHIPGDPIFPGVLMLEAAAHVAAFMECYARPDFDGFVGYGGVDDCKFRRTVVPPARMWWLCSRIESRPRRIITLVQGVVDDTLSFEAKITGMIIRE